MSTSIPLVVGVGASAGGLEAFTDLLSGISDNPGVAIVFVQHLDPNNQSLLADLLRKQTSLSVEEVTTRKKIKPNTVYLCPPRGRLNIRDDSLVVSKQTGDDSESNVIDHFFHSIAETQGERGVGVILSGSGSDGTLGLKSISDAGGMTFAQDSESAKFDSMPRNAATTGVADQVMPPAAIAAELTKYVHYLSGLAEAPAKKQFDEQIKVAIPQIAEALLTETGHNFKHYKTSTLARRIQRRMQVLKLTNVNDYATLLGTDKDESQQLFRELLISVTAFFRDPDSFERLAEEVIPKLFVNRQTDAPVRIWVPGCATGEEAYTIAMLCREYLDRSDKLAACKLESEGDAKADKLAACGYEKSLQIFASDIDERALGIARAGIYPAGIADHVSEERLKKFFVKKGKRYHVKNEIRETVLFSPHNLISDPPFSRQDMISCRNLLIYLGPHLQKKLIPLFHFALRPNGFLFLGPSESILTHGDLFRSVDQRHRISQRKGTTIRRGAPLSPRTHSGRSARLPEVSAIDDDRSDVVQIMQRIILDEFAPKSVVIDEDGQIICSSADVSKYLTFGDGAFQNNILKMARCGLRVGLRATLSEAKAKRRRIVHENLSVKTDDGKQRVMITVQPMMRLGEDSGLFIVVFHDVGLPLGLSEDPLVEADELITRGAVDRQADAMIEQLERELATTRDDLEKTMQEMESANEELKSSNEELLSMNEELQSANEELETSKEEIRASSEAVGRANADLKNLLSSTRIATIFLDDDRCIRSFTPAATDIYGLIPTDTGRPLTQIVPNVQSMPPLPSPQSLLYDEPIEDTVTTHDGQTYIRRVLPYQDEHGDTSGMVVTFTDVTPLKETQELFQLLVEASSQIVWITNPEGFVTEDSPTWRAFTGQTVQQWLGHGWLDAIHPDDRDATMTQWQQVVRSGEPLSLQYRLQHTSGRYRWMQVNAVAQRKPDGSVKRWVGMNIDMDDQKSTQQSLIESKNLLAEAKERLELSLEVSGVATWNWNMETDGVISNPALNRMFGFDPEENLTVDKFIDQMDESVQVRVSAAIENAVKNGGTYDQEYPIRLRDGSVRHVRAVGKVYQADAARPQHFFGVVLDVTERKLRELETAEREAHLRRVINNQLGLVGVIDRDGVLVEIDDRSLKIAQARREHVIGKHFADAPWWTYDPKVAEEMRSAMDRAFAGETVRYDVSLFAHGDDGVMIDFMIAPVMDDDGEVEFLIPSGVDIRERKAFEIALQDRQHYLRNVIDGSIAFLGILDDAGRLLEANRLALNVVGKTREEVLQIPFWDAPWWAGNQDSQDSIKEAFETTKDGRLFRRDLVYITDAGESRFVDFSMTPVLDAHGQFQFAIASGLDITDRKENEQAIRLNEERLRVAAGAAGFGMFHVDLDNNQVVWSNEFKRLVGIDINEKVEVEIGSIPDFVHPDDVAMVRENIDKILTDIDEADHWFNHRIVKKNGDIRYIRVQTRSLYDSGGDQKRIKMIVGTLLDITKQREFETKLKKAKRIAEAANASKSEFVANMSHEIRTPMTAILGYAEMLRDVIDDETAIGHLGTIRRNGDYLLEIINDILDLSKIEAGKLDVDIERFEPARVIEDVRSIMEVRATENGLKLEVNYETEIPKYIESDAKRLKQILINLLGNAIKFTSEGEVKIDVAYQSTMLRFSVTDTGIGMTNEQQERLFKPFSQGDSLITQQFGGTGLGLAISQRLAAMLGGEISVDSKLNTGSTFTVTVKVGDLNDTTLIRPTDLAEPHAEANEPKDVRLSAHVLIVDDRRDIRFLSKHILTKAGGTVTEAEDGLLAVETVKQATSDGTTFDLILLDMQMPNMDGYETAAALRKLGYTGPIIALTADAMQGDMSKCLEAGCNDYLSKPIDKNRMLEKVYHYVVENQKSGS